MNVDVFRSLRGDDEEEEGLPINVSYFHRALAKQVANSSQHDDFAAFHWEVARLCLTLPLLLPAGADRPERQKNELHSR